MSLRWVRIPLLDCTQYVLFDKGLAVPKYWINDDEDGVTMKSPDIDFTDAATVAEAMAVLESHYILREVL
jgi:hypothetical protein